MLTHNTPTLSVDIVITGDMSEANAYYSIQKTKTRQSV